jgi:hypothetical protein
LFVEKFQKMESNRYQLNQQELEAQYVMRVNREAGVYPSYYPCSDFMRSAGILEDVQSLISRAGLNDFVDGEPCQYAKLTMSDVNQQGLTSGGFLRARVWIKVDVPLRRCIAIDSSRRESCDWYELEYEDLPYFCFACGLIGQADIFCPNPGERDEQGRWPYSSSLRAPDDVKTKRQFTSSWNNNMGSRDSRLTGNAEHGPHVPPPNQGVQGGWGDGSGRGRGGGRNRGGPVNMQVYRRLEMQPTGTVNGGGMDVDSQLVVSDLNAAGAKRDSTEDPRTREEAPNPEAKKPKGNPSDSENSATAAEQLRQSQ